jgi:TfoX/Sxy family transcriptional regulator of competence genes
MAYDEELADWVRTFLKGDKALKGERAVEGKRMFGGLGMLVGGNMAVAVRGKGGLLVRVDPEDADDILREPGAKMMKMRGKEMRGWITVDPKACTKRADVQRWVKRGVTFAKSLPVKNA